MSPLIIQGGSATSTRLRGEPNAYNRVILDGETLSVERRVWTGTEWVTRGEKHETSPGPVRAAESKPVL